jgi:hypothetical protein
MTARIALTASALIVAAYLTVDASIAGGRCIPDFTGDWHLSTVEGPITLHIKMDPNPPTHESFNGGQLTRWRLMGYGTDASGRNGYLCAEGSRYESSGGQTSVTYEISIDWSIPTSKYSLDGICSGRHELTDFYGKILNDGTVKPDQNGYAHVDHATNHVFKEGYPYEWAGTLPCSGVGPFPGRVPVTRMEPNTSGTAIREPAGGGFADAACPKPIIGDPGIVPPPPMYGTYETDFGTLTLGGNGGSYSYKSGHVCIAKIVANFMEGTWTQSESGQRCADGTYHGRFRFNFNKDGFTGTYGYCEGAPNAGPWNGRRL